MSEEKAKENLAEINEGDLNKSVENFGIGANNSDKERPNKEKLYKTEKQRIEQAIERSGEKLRQGTSATQSINQNQIEIQTSAKEIAEMDANDQVEHLLQIAQTKDPYLALQIAKHLRDNYVLSELHSDLTEDKMRELFVSKGLL